MTAYQNFQTLVDNNQRWGQITVIKFINRDATHNGMERICFGTGRGHLLMYHPGRKFVCPLSIPLVSVIISYHKVGIQGVHSSRNLRRGR